MDSYHNHRPQSTHNIHPAPLPPAKHLGEDVRKPPKYAGRFALSLWRLQLWFECTFGLTVMEPWERMVVRTSLISRSYSQSNLFTLISLGSHLLRNSLAARLHGSHPLLPPETRWYTTKDNVLPLGSRCRRNSYAPARVIDGALSLSTCAHTRP